MCKWSHYSILLRVCTQRYRNHQSEEGLTRKRHIEANRMRSVRYHCFACIVLCLCISKCQRDSRVCLSVFYSQKTPYDSLLVTQTTSSTSLPLHASFKLSLFHFLYHCVCLYWVTSYSMNPIQMSFCFGLSECRLINVRHILPKRKFLKHYTHIYVFMWSQHCTITCLVLRGSAKIASM